MFGCGVFHRSRSRRTRSRRRRRPGGESKITPTQGRESCRHLPAALGPGVGQGTSGTHTAERGRRGDAPAWRIAAAGQRAGPDRREDRSTAVPATIKAVSLRVVADFPDFDRRLIGANVWLVERLPNGKEQSQLQSLRGVPHRPIPFYFDSVPDGTKRFDIFGKLVADPATGRHRVHRRDDQSAGRSGQDGYQSARWFKSTVHVKPNEIVDVALPRCQLRREGRRHWPSASSRSGSRRSRFAKRQPRRATGAICRR